MHQTGSLSNIVALIGITLLTVLLAHLQPARAFSAAMAADTDTAPLSVASSISPSPDKASAIRLHCGKAHVQYNKLTGYQRCLADQGVEYESTAWCPVVKTFCDAQWYPFGDKARCFTERGCPAS